MLKTRYTLVYVALMTLVVVASNFLVQFPLNAEVAGINLADLLTWGAFSYPVAFLITDLTNRQFGPQAARKVVFAGFVVGIALSFFTAVPRIAIASGSAYLAGQLLDISVFNRLRRQTWWRAPLVGSLFGSVLDTAIFFSLCLRRVLRLPRPERSVRAGSRPRSSASCLPRRRAGFPGRSATSR